MVVEGCQGGLIALPLGHVPLDYVSLGHVINIAVHVYSDIPE